MKLIHLKLIYLKLIHLFSLSLLLLAVGIASPLRAEAKLPAGGVSLLPSDPLPGFLPALADDRISLVAVTGQPFTQALHLKTLVQPANSWDFQIGTATVADVKKGDTLFATFELRVVETQTGYGRTNLVFENAVTYNKSVFYTAAAAGAWKPFTVAFAAAEDEPAGKANLHFHLGFLPQVIEIADVHLTDYGTAVKPGDLPTTSLTYDGRGPDAPWRKAAAARIEQIRKGNLKVVVTDAHGRSVPGAHVKVAMTRHAFAFGSALDNATWLPTPDAPYARRYREETYARFNKATVGNALKWPPWEGKAYGYNSMDDQWHHYSKAEALTFVQTMREHHLAVRGHNLVWPSWGYLPDDLQTLKTDPPALAKRITDHITEEVSTLKGQCTEWDVINEPYSNHDVLDILGDHAMVDWFQTAHAADPAARLFINDNGIMESNGEDTAHADSYEKTIQYLLANGAPLGGIGMEGHYSNILTPPDKLLTFLDRFGKFGLPIQTSEFDVDTADEQLQADYLRDYMTVTFSHPAVSGFILWGFWEGDHWIPQAALWHKDWTIKPNGKVWMDLVFHQWWTNVSGDTNASGTYQTRGFLGDYTVTVTAAGRTRTVQTSLVKPGTMLSIVL